MSMFFLIKSDCLLGVEENSELPQWGRTRELKSQMGLFTSSILTVSAEVCCSPHLRTL